MKNGNFIFAIGCILTGAILLVAADVVASSEILSAGVVMLLFGMMVMCLGLGLMLGIVNQDDKVQVPKQL